MKITAKDTETVRLMAEAAIAAMRQSRGLKSNQPLTRADYMKVKNSVRDTFMRWKKQQGYR